MYHPDVDHNHIENRSLEILDQYNITHPVVDVFKIAAENKIQIKEVKMPDKFSDVSGFYNKDEKTIYLDQTDPPHRKLFTIAHELGHIFLGHTNYGVRFRIPKDNSDYSKDEREANSFAAHLLMPEFMVKEYLEKLNWDRSDYVKMAKIFGVSLPAMKNTLAYLH